MSFATLVGPNSAKYANRVVVAKKGGNFTTIQEAIDSIADASEDNRYLIQVAPGLYSEQVTMKSWVDLRGAGKHATRIEFTGNDDGTVIMADDCQIEDVLIELSDVSTEWAVVSDDKSNVHVRNVDLLSRDDDYVSNGLKIVGSTWHTVFLEHMVINYRGETGHAILIEGDSGSPQDSDLHLNDVFADALNATTGGCVEIKDCSVGRLRNCLLRVAPSASGAFALKTTRTSAGTVDVSVDSTSLLGTSGNALVVGANTTVYWYGGSFESATNSGSLVFHKPESKGATVSRATNQSISNTTDTAVQWTTEVLDDFGLFDPGSDTRLTAKVSGWYAFSAYVDWATSGTGDRFTNLRLNGTTFLYSSGNGSPGSGDQRQSISGLENLSAGDYIEVVVFQSSGGPLNVNAARASMVRVG